MKAQWLDIMQHALGLDEYGRREKNGTDRNRYVTDAGVPEIDAMVAAGLMGDLGAVKFTGGMHCYYVTDAGRAYVREHSPAPPKLTRSQRRYEQWLDADCGMRFGDWLKMRA